uniref:Testis expressed 48 n=1 Tax=Sus scrofa TaxID=9823 RepID=A0A8D0RZV3_PIG
MAAHQNLALKIFCLCCKYCEEPSTIDDSKTPSQTQELQPPKHGLRKDELDGQNPKHKSATPCIVPGQCLIRPGKTASCFSSSEFEDVNSHVSKRGFHKRNLNRYSQDHWPYPPCRIGRP